MRQAEEAGASTLWPAVCWRSAAHVQCGERDIHSTRHPASRRRKGARAQLRDTCDLFCFKRQRRLSLRFLASYLLGLDIQAATHDSIEDARTALDLFRLYERLVAEGSLQARLLDMYRWGKAHGWRAL